MSQLVVEIAMCLMAVLLVASLVYLFFIRPLPESYRAEEVARRNSARQSRVERSVVPAARGVPSCGLNSLAPLLTASVVRDVAQESAKNCSSRSWLRRSTFILGATGIHKRTRGCLFEGGLGHYPYGYTHA